ncbi:MAG: hypothetical protein RSC76_03880 [Oscillospiraceae bacterium]
MKVVHDKSGFVSGFALLGEIPGALQEDFPVPEDFRERYEAYRPEGGKLIFDSQRWGELEAEKKAQAIRLRREKECFPIINRGKLWYDTLRAAEVEELNLWYRQWLDAPQTGVTPQKPAFLAAEVGR